MYVLLAAAGVVNPVGDWVELLPTQTMGFPG
jgi:hypothetical protein